MGQSDKKGLAGLMFVFLLSVVGLSLTPTINSMVTDAVAQLTAGTAAATLLGLFPLFWVILLIAIPIAAIYVWMHD